MEYTQAEILQTVRMTEMEHLDVRTVTLGLSLRDCASDGDREPGLPDAAGTGEGHQAGERGVEQRERAEPFAADDDDGEQGEHRDRADEPAGPEVSGSGL